ncbi:MAG: YitT family protein [Lachnospiraceae bacterium]
MKKIEKKWSDLAYILVGTFLMAMSINLVFDPMGLVTGGVTGFAIAVKYISSFVIEGGIPVWLTNLLCNVPLFLVALWKKGRKYIMKTLFATISLTAWLYIVPVHQIFDDMILATVFGSVLAGGGIGMVFSTMATTGGTDLLCALIHDKVKYLSIPRLLAVVDGIIVILGAVVFGLTNALYAIMVVYLCSKISDSILQGAKFAKMAQVISDHADEIAQVVMRELDRGATGVNVQGMYSGTDKRMLYCVVSKKEIVELIDIVHRIDPKAFVIVNDVREVMGEGFIEFRQ